jgi:molybdopterin synthase catalytic subunit
MRVKLLLFAGCREAVGSKELEIELPEGTSTVEEALEVVVDRFPQLRGIAKSVAIARNAEYVPGDAPIADGDELAIIPPVSGG